MLKRGSSRFNIFITFMGILLCLLTFLFVRSGLYLPENIYKYWNSDNAIFVLMAEDIKQFVDFPFFYWGGNYLGPLNNMTMAITQLIFEVFGYKELVPHLHNKYFVVSPLAAIVSTSTLLFSSFAILYIAISKLFDKRVAFISVFLMSIGSALLIRSSVRPLAPEVSLLLGALVIWRGHSLIGKNSFSNQLTLGFLIGLSWWMNQITVFVIAPLMFYYFSETKEYRFFRELYPWKKSLLLRSEELLHHKIKKPIRIFLRFVYTIIGINFLMGLTVASLGGINTRLLGIKLKIHNGFSPMKTSLIIFIILQLIIWLCLEERVKERLKSYFDKMKGFIIGAALGYGPVLLGRILGFYEKGYKPTFKFVAPSELLPYWYKLISNFFPHLLGQSSPIEIILLYLGFLGLLIPTFILNKSEVLSYLRFAPRRYGKRSAFYGIVFFNLIYIFLCERSRNQYAYRYAILSMPVIFVFIASKLNETSKYTKVVSLCMILLLGQGLYRQGRAEVNKIESSFDLRPITRNILKSDCEVIYTDYFWAYLLEYFTQKERLFFVSRGFKRTPKRNIQLITEGAKKCDFDEKLKILKEL